jgi:hypothetical protein
MRFQGQLQNFRDAISSRGAPPQLGIVAFLDGTLRRTCRPGPDPSRLPPGVTMNALKRAQYNGHKKHHGLKFQNVVAPNGIILASFGPIDGRRSDAFMLLASGIFPLLHQMTDSTGAVYRLFGDSIYPMLPQLFRMFRAPAAGSPREALNRVMSGCRVRLECGLIWSLTLSELSL